ncbi:MAG TPA: DUF6644 family protein [Gammaproteobacteria bacterium]
MDLMGIVQSVEASGVGEWMRTSLKAMPVVEAIHVMAGALVFGSILIVDARLIGLLDTKRPVTLISRELLRFTWAGFALAVVTGATMFTANASTYFDNTAFRLKMLALLGAGVNMAVFHLFTFKTVPRWDRDAAPPAAARAAGALSILIWVCVIFFGRWIGFTKGYDFEVPEGIDFDFSSIQMWLFARPFQAGGEG